MNKWLYCALLVVSRGQEAAGHLGSGTSPPADGDQAGLSPKPEEPFSSLTRLV